MNVLLDIAERARSLTPALEAMADLATDRLESGFESETDPEGVPWTPLKPETLAQKETPKIMTETFQLRRHVTNPVNADFTPSSVRIGPRTGDPKAAHQKGATTGFGATLPARPFVGVSDDAAEPLGLILLAHLRGLTL